MDIYCLDTSFFVNGWRKHWGPDVFPAVWEYVSRSLASGESFSCEEVYRELREQDDDLRRWVTERKKSFIQPTDDVIQEVMYIMRMTPHFAAKGSSRNAADPWVIALARRRKAIVVTDEQYQTQEPKRKTKPPKIPNVCEELGELRRRSD